MWNDTMAVKTFSHRDQQEAHHKNCYVRSMLQVFVKGIMLTQPKCYLLPQWLNPAQLFPINEEWGCSFKKIWHFIILFCNNHVSPHPKELNMIYKIWPVIACNCKRYVQKTPHSDTKKSTWMAIKSSCNNKSSILQVLSNNVWTN